MFQNEEMLKSAYQKMKEIGTLISQTTRKKNTHELVPLVGGAFLPYNLTFLLVQKHSAYKCFK
jgi:hypothetical protein